MNLHQVSLSYPLGLFQNGKTVTVIEEDMACSHGTEKSTQMTALKFSPPATDKQPFYHEKPGLEKNCYLHKVMSTYRISPVSSRYWSCFW